jgi:hypothetical protein
MKNKLIILLLIVLLVNTGFSAPPPMEPGVYGFSRIHLQSITEIDGSNFEVIFLNDYNAPAKVTGIEVRGIMGDDEYCNVTPKMPLIVNANGTFLAGFNNCTSLYRDHENHVSYDIEVSFNLMLPNGSSDFDQTSYGRIITGPKNSSPSVGQLFFFAIALIYALIGLYLAARCIHHRENLKDLITWFIILIATLLYIFIISNIGYY